MQPRYEEKTFESYFNTELDRRTSIYFPFGQVQEGGIGADAAGHSRNRWLWRRLGYRYFLRHPFNGASLRDIADEMERHIGREIRNIPRIKANLLFQYKRPELIGSKLGLEWPHWNKKYFRYDIYQDQQVLLEQLDSKFGNEALVLYASPALESIDDLVETKRSGRIIENTNFRKAVERSGHHRNTYIKAGTHSIACSEPESLESFDLLTSLERLEGTRNNANSEVILRFAKEVRLAATENAFLGKPYRTLLETLLESGIEQYPFFFAIASMSIFRELSGTQWALAIAEDDI